MTFKVKVSAAISLITFGTNQVDTALGGTEKLTLTVDAGGLKVNNAQVNSFNIHCTNGVIQAIDTVLLPTPKRDWLIQDHVVIGL